MSQLVKEWWTMLSETQRQAILAEYGILPGNTLGRECFSYGLVNTNLPAFAQLIVNTAYSER